jgi:hypothetical protein
MLPALQVELESVLASATRTETTVGPERLTTLSGPQHGLAQCGDGGTQSLSAPVGQGKTSKVGRHPLGQGWHAAAHIRPARPSPVRRPAPTPHPQRRTNSDDIQPTLGPDPIHRQQPSTAKPRTTSQRPHRRTISTIRHARSRQHHQHAKQHTVTNSPPTTTIKKPEISIPTGWSSPHRGL